MVIERIHWYITDRCNLDCGYCFKQKFNHGNNERQTSALAHILAENDIKKITIGGGEPTLVKNLSNVVNILKKGGKYVSIHTNGILLNDEVIANADDIALPIDSTKIKIQEQLRGKRFLSVFNKVSELSSRIKDSGKKLGYHTVFTAINHKEIPAIYKFIKNNEFDYWRIYEFNDTLASSTVLSSCKNQKKLRTKLLEINRLKGNINLEKGCTDCLLAYFLLSEREMKRHRDSRIQFVGRRDAETYAFLDNSGDINFYSWFSGKERRVIGNIFNDSFKFIEKRLDEIDEKVWEYDEKSMDEFNKATFSDLPIWARIWNGDYSSEELEEIKPRYLDKVVKLTKLYTKREYGVSLR